MRADVSARGPDHYGSVSPGNTGVTFEASILSLRQPYTPQPLTDVEPDSRRVLCYNGEIYDLPPEETQDTEFVWGLCKSHPERVFDIEGEFALVYFDADSQTIWFGRDKCGRRSLLYYEGVDGQLVVSSVNGGPGFTECEALGTYYTYSLEKKKVKRHEGQPLSVANRGVGDFAAAAETTVARTIDHLRTAVQKRVETQEYAEHSELALLFSGGLDCMLIASLMDGVLPSHVGVQLLNVAFENKRTGTLWDTPDRLLARRSIGELQRRSIHPDRFRLVEINVPYAKMLEHVETVKHLMSPNHTVIDLSIALAFYFASMPQPEMAAPRILFSGLGADELFAGYSRHTNAPSPDALAAELDMDFQRLPHRNLGRDDRVCASWGREVRYPFLDEEVVQLAMGLPLSAKSDGKTTKIVLRNAAVSLGLTDVAQEKKRAIQFGARSAKMDPGSGKAKGHHELAGMA